MSTRDLIALIVLVVGALIVVWLVMNGFVEIARVNS
jgi:ABC-type lipoprotein release transport system permease subunit